MKVELKSVDSLVGYHRNSRAHSDEQISQLCRGIEEYGWTNPILADGSSIVAGHGRLEAAKRLYSAKKTIKLPGGGELKFGHVPVIDCSGWDENKRKAYIIWDNKSSDLSGWNMELLKLELTELRAEDFDLSLTGFSADELFDLLDPIKAEDKDPDAAPDVPVVPHSKLGDIWQLGPHFVMCGDSTSESDWDALMKGELADAVWTDPPYNVAYESKLAGKIQNDDMSDSQFFDFLTDVFSRIGAVMKPGAGIYVSYPDRESHAFHSTFKFSGFKLSGVLVWKKNALVLGRTDYQNIHEPIIYGWKPGSKHRWYGGRKQVTVQELGDASPFEKLPDGRYAIRVGDAVMYVTGEAVVEQSPASLIYCDKPKRSAQHPTMKPVELIEKMLKHSARKGDIVVDAFGGSGSTLMAAERLGMSARCMELDPRFVDVICRRYFDYTGRKPVNANNGEPFPV